MLGAGAKLGAGAICEAGLTSGGADPVVVCWAEAGPRTTKDAEINNAQAAAPRIKPSRTDGNEPPEMASATRITQKNDNRLGESMKVAQHSLRNRH
jgi:hypothetical protein